MLALLQTNCDRLLEQYENNLHTVKELQTLYIQDILPSIAEEFGWDSDATQWAQEWLKDKTSVFQMLRRNNYTKSTTLESLRKTLMWRYSTLWPPTPDSSHLTIPRIRCLPTEVSDPCGRPILLIQAQALNFDDLDTYQTLGIQTIEALRLHLVKLNSDAQTVVLQYVIVVDLQRLSMSSVRLDLVTWFLREVIPRFPGLLASVFMINHSWTHSGLWTIVKRLLPSSALGRVFFLTQEELAGYFTQSCLPQDYGGTLPPLRTLRDPLKPDTKAVSVDRQVENPGSTTRPSIISSTSILNPFYGYPVHLNADLRLHLHHGRRRKRDLIKTLLSLFWLRWGDSITSIGWILAFIFAARTLKRVVTSPTGLAALSAFWSSI
ncbi:CRAL-TRIO domain-containing protein [Mycena floridula]|nr:CRAL-TRIO domain-containing protein [Mycena floridula]